MYPYLSSPIKINTVEIKNRIAYPALGLFYSYDRKLNERYYRFFQERAEGGVGMLTVGPVGIDYLGSGRHMLSLDNDDAISDFRKLTRIIKDGGATPWIQLFHAGAYSHPNMLDGKQPIAPSVVYSRYSKTTPREMTLDDIEEVQDAYAKASVRAKEAGFEGIEIIGSAGYLITQFLSPLKNKRTDQYGGSFENRTRFPKEVILRIRDQVGPDFPLTIRMAGNDFVESSITDSETPDIAKIYETAGIDAINVTGGWHETRVPQLTMELPRAAFAFLSLNIKKEVNIPVMASNRITDPDTAEQVIEIGYADMVNLGRVLIADPKWPKKAFDGRKDEIRPCTACSQGCADQVFQHQPVFCVGNPIAGFEAEREIRVAAQPKSVMVIGAGVAGLEATVTSVKAGHKVALYEKNRDIGGQLWIAGLLPHKNELLEFIRYYRSMINKYDIPLYLNTIVTGDMVKQNQPNHVILAEGAEELIPSIDGLDDTSVLSSRHVLSENPRLGKRVGIIGGGAVGLETALFVAAKGTLTPDVLHFLFTYDAISVDRLRELMFTGTSTVTVFEMLPQVGKNVGKSTKWVLFDNIARYGIAIKTDTKVLAIKNGVITYEKNNQFESMTFDNVILACGSKSVNTMTQEMEKLDIPYTAIGDCIRPGKINDAIHKGFLAAINL